MSFKDLRMLADKMSACLMLFPLHHADFVKFFKVSFYSQRFHQSVTQQKWTVTKILDLSEV